ncbi:hypothetical protein [Sporosarcina obsidiansis]|uniref:hypothetical protein n=1 Tax=Sporosarcina obsidiansis TaxID=2660748 RepID=UPI00129B6242|nr:hypothetical protein [Sporosarcina obsidiansis]
MKVQSSTAMGYFNTLKNQEGQEQNISNLFLNEDDKKNNKPKFVVRNEGGYIRNYIIKANGDKILLMETKQTEAQEGIKSDEASVLIDTAHAMLMKQLEQLSNPMQQKKQAAWEKENGISKYITSI